MRDELIYVLSKKSSLTKAELNEMTTGQILNIIKNFNK